MEKKTLKYYSTNDILHLINERIHNERNRSILKRRFIDGICYEPLAEEFNLSVRQVKRIVYKEQEKLLNDFFIF